MSTIMPRRFISLTTSRAEIRETVVGGRVSRRIGPVRVAEVGQRHGADAEPVIGPQHRQVVGDGMPALDREYRRDLPRFPDPLDV
jgi:hypothetical protein